MRWLILWRNVSCGWISLLSRISILLRTIGLAVLLCAIRLTVGLCSVGLTVRLCIIGLAINLCSIRLSVGLRSIRLTIWLHSACIRIESILRLILCPIDILSRWTNLDGCIHFELIYGLSRMEAPSSSDLSFKIVHGALIVNLVFSLVLLDK